MQPQALLRNALAFWGPQHQLRKTQEECLELALAISRYQEGRHMSHEHLIEELADVEIMLAQMRAHFGAREIDIAVTAKLERLQERLDAAD